MLGQIADHSRIVNPTPTDGFVQQRRAAVEKLISEESITVEVLESFVEFAVFGVPNTRSKRHETATNALIAAIQDAQPSFAADVDANQLDLRLVSSVVIGERLRAEPTDDWNVYLASLIISALLLQPLPQQLYIARLLQDLVGLAKVSLGDTSKQQRERQPWPKKAQVEITGADIPALARSAKTAFEVLLNAVASNANADREELDVLWWVFGRRSARTGETFESMAEGERALVAAIELSDRMLMPPIPTAQQLLGSLVSDDTRISLAQLVEQASKDTLTELTKKKAGVATVLDSNPALLPLTSLATRLLASDLSPGWQPEFKKKTKLKANAPVALGDWARQAFAECVAQRLALPLLPEPSAT